MTRRTRYRTRTGSSYVVTEHDDGSVELTREALGASHYDDQHHLERRARDFAGAVCGTREIVAARSFCGATEDNPRARPVLGHPIVLVLSRDHDDHLITSPVVAIEDAR